MLLLIIMFKKYNYYKKLTQYLEKISLMIASNLFISSIAIILLVLIIPFFIYLGYIKSLSDIGKESFKNPFLLEKIYYEKIENIWENNKKAIEVANFKVYPNPFFKKIPSTGNDQKK